MVMKYDASRRSATSLAERHSDKSQALEERLAQLPKELSRVPNSPVQSAKVSITVYRGSPVIETPEPFQHKIGIGAFHDPDPGVREEAHRLTDEHAYHDFCFVGVVPYGSNIFYVMPSGVYAQAFGDKPRFLIEEDELSPEIQNLGVCKTGMMNLLNNIHLPNEFMQEPYRGALKNKFVSVVAGGNCIKILLPFTVEKGDEEISFGELTSNGSAVSYQKPSASDVEVIPTVQETEYTFTVVSFPKSLPLSTTEVKIAEVKGRIYVFEQIEWRNLTENPRTFEKHFPDISLRDLLIENVSTASVVDRAVRIPRPLVNPEVEVHPMWYEIF